MTLGYAQGTDVGTALCYRWRYLDLQNTALISRHEDTVSGFRKLTRMVEINLKK
jgi:hypothetical protein